MKPRTHVVRTASWFDKLTMKRIRRRAPYSHLAGVHLATTTGAPFLISAT